MEVAKLSLRKSLTISAAWPVWLHVAGGGSTKLSMQAAEWVYFDGLQGYLRMSMKFDGDATNRINSAWHWQSLAGLQPLSGTAGSKKCMACRTPCVDTHLQCAACTMQDLAAINADHCCSCAVVTLNYNTVQCDTVQCSGQHIIVTEPCSCRSPAALRALPVSQNNTQ
jgi:hypothetical protein